MPKWQDEIAPTTPCVSALDASAIVDCNYTTFTGDYPADWIAALDVSRGLDHRTVICLDPDDNAWQLTALFKSMRALSQRRDVKFRDYQSQDVDLNFLDPDGVLDPTVVGSLLYGETWKWMQVFVGSWLVGTQKVLAHTRMYLQDIRHEEGVTTFRCTDIFGRLSTIYLRANDDENLELTTAAGTLSGVTVLVADAQIESWTLTFDTATTFDVYGTLTGSDGSGSTGANFTSTSGSIYIGTASWGGTWAPGDTVTFDAIMVDPPPAQEPWNLFLGAFTWVQIATDLIAADVLDSVSWAQAVIDFPEHIGRYYARTQLDVVSFIRDIARHGPATAYPDGNGKIALAYFRPTIAQSVARVVCKSLDLSSLKTERLPVYGSVTVNFAPGASGSPTRSVRWPTSPTSSEDPLSISLLGFASDRSAAALHVAQEIYAQFQESREVYEIQLLPVDLNVNLEDVMWIDSSRPNRQGYAIVYQTDKDLGNLSLRVGILNADWIIQPPGACGYGFCDVGHRCDDCWICW